MVSSLVPGSMASRPALSRIEPISASHPHRRALCLVVLECPGLLPYSCPITARPQEGTRMSTEQRRPDTDSAAERGRSGPGSQPARSPTIVA